MRGVKSHHVMPVIVGMDVLLVSYIVYRYPAADRAIRTRDPATHVVVELRLVRYLSILIYDMEYVVHSPALPSFAGACKLVGHARYYIHNLAAAISEVLLDCREDIERSAVGVSSVQQPKRVGARRAKPPVAIGILRHHAVAGAAALCIHGCNDHILVCHEVVSKGSTTSDNS